MRTSLAVFVFFCSLVAPSRVFAGACPVCTTDADCEALTGPPAFCVLHDHDIGCGTQRQTCCPGQGCAVGADGRPSCEGTTCMVVGGGGADSGPIPVDSGTTTADSGPGVDGGGAPIDGGGPGVDGGGGPTSTGGCGCRAGGATRPLAPCALAALALIALAVRRR